LLSYANAAQQISSITVTVFLSLRQTQRYLPASEIKANTCTNPCTLCPKTRCNLQHYASALLTDPHSHPTHCLARNASCLLTHDSLSSVTGQSRLTLKLFPHPDRQSDSNTPPPPKVIYLISTQPEMTYREVEVQLQPFLVLGIRWMVSSRPK
jgi:hypothetical protein